MAHLLNDKWLDEALLGALRKKADADLAKLRNAVARLAWAEIPVKTYDELKAVSASMVDERIDEAVSGYRLQAKSLMLSDALLDEALDRYEDTRRELKDHVATVHAFIEHYPEVTIKVDRNNKAWLDSKALDKYLTDKATSTYSKLDKSYYTKLGTLVDALNDLCEFEEANNITPFATKDCQNPYTGGVVNLYDEKTGRYKLTRSLFCDMRRAELILAHVPTADEVQELRRRLKMNG